LTKEGRFPLLIGYTGTILKYIWRKRVGPHWLQARNEEFTRRFGAALALIERPGSERVLLEISCRTRKRAQELVDEFGGNAEPLQRAWLQNFAKQAQGKPLRIGSRLIVLSEPAQREIATRTLIIPAETAFGTGHHATTAMCLRLLEGITRRLAPGWRMLDAGTGTGILALAGSCFSAGEVFAIDNDPLASTTAKRNARANRIRNIEFAAGDILKQKPTGKFEIITANLFSEILIAALPVWSRHLAANGHMIFSGILRSQESDVIRALRRHGFAILEIRRRGKWIALLANSSERPPRRTPRRAVPTSKKS
jgi:ribosomal protein L11 methyltransferase